MKILIIAAYSDDKGLGRGGTIARHTAEGDKIELMLFKFLTTRLSYKK